MGKKFVCRAGICNIASASVSYTHLLMDGRDIGTNVLPDASLKIYLTASADVRAKRRYDELKEKGADCDIDVYKRQTYYPQVNEWRGQKNIQIVIQNYRFKNL